MINCLGVIDAKDILTPQEVRKMRKKLKRLRHALKGVVELSNTHDMLNNKKLYYTRLETINKGARKALGKKWILE